MAVHSEWGKLPLLNLITTTLLEKKEKGPQAKSLRRKAYKAKRVLAGDVLQVYEYEKIQSTVRPGKARKAKEPGGEKKGRVRMDSVYRARSRCTRLINTNARKGKNPDKFVTLTFAENMTDLDAANREFHKFIKRLEYFVGHKVAYVAVPQIQWERFKKYGVKVWHYHVYFFGLDYIPNAKLNEIWAQGFVRINAIENIQNVGTYVSRYMEKDFSVEGAANHRRFTCSIGLEQPQEERAMKADDLLSDISDEFMLEYEKEYQNNPNMGWVKYRRYQRKKQEGQTLTSDTRAGSFEREREVPPQDKTKREE